MATGRSSSSMSSPSPSPVALLLASLLLFLGGGGAPLVIGARSPPGGTQAPKMLAANDNNGSHWRSYSTKGGFRTFNTISNTVLHYAAVQTHPAEYYGAKGVLSVHHLQEIPSDDTTVANVLLASTRIEEILGAGWHINAKMYGDNRVHFFTLWGTEAYNSRDWYNLDYPGFVVEQGSSIVPGSVLTSVDELTITIQKDFASGDWVLYVGSTKVGRWPKSLFNRLKNLANVVAFNGRVEYPKGSLSPVMGNGHFAGRNSAYINGLQFVDDHSRLVDFVAKDFVVWADAAECYNSMLTTTTGPSGLQVDLHYGGPSGCQNQA